MDTHLMSDDFLQPFIRLVGDRWQGDFFVGNIHCGQCVFKLEKKLRQQSEVSDYQLSREGKHLHLEVHTPQQMIRVARTLEENGFPLTPLQEQADDTPEYLEFKTEIKQLAVAGVGAGNIMLYSTAVYFGAQGPYAHFFNGISFAVFVPVFLYAGRPILKGFWRGISSGQFNLDIPIGLAMTFGAVYSGINYIVGSEQVYFDSIALVLFLVLLSRFVLNRYLKQFYQKQGGEIIPGVKVARIHKDGRESFVQPGSVEADQTVIVKKGEVVPVDGVLQSSTAYLDTAVISGEAEPQLFHQGQKVVAGARLCHGEISINSTASGRETRMGQIINQAIRNFEQAKEQRLGMIAWFTQGILLSSLLVFLIFGYLGMWGEAFHRAFAIIIVACPCAISFGFPLIRFLSSRLALQKGMVLKTPAMLPKLKEIKHFCFDKTGTLTSSKIDVGIKDLNQFEPEDLQALFSLEAQMEHPISRGILSHRQEDIEILPVVDFEFLPGKGIQGTVGSNHYQVLSVESEAGSKQIGFFKNDQLLGKLLLKPSVRESSSQLLDDLAQNNIKVSLLSGDQEEHVQKVWAMVPEAIKGKFLAAATPEEKQAYIRSLDEPTLMVGDGVNDVAALQAADIGVSLPGALASNQQLSDVSLLKTDLNMISQLTLLASKVVNTENRVFAFTIFYNIICVILASLGYISPVVAAILMPISSVTILSIIFWNLGGEQWK